MISLIMDLTFDANFRRLDTSWQLPDLVFEKKRIFGSLELMN